MTGPLVEKPLRGWQIRYRDPRKWKSRYSCRHLQNESRIKTGALATVTTRIANDPRVADAIVTPPVQMAMDPQFRPIPIHQAAQVGRERAIARVRKIGVVEAQTVRRMVCHDDCRAVEIFRQPSADGRAVIAMPCQRIGWPVKSV